MPVKSYPKHLMTSGETATIARRTVECINGYTDDDPHLKELSEDLEQGVEMVESALNAGVDLSLSADVRQGDTDRDQTITQFTGFVRGLQNSLEAEIADAASVVYEIMERHDFGAKRSAYAEQSTVVNAMLKDFETEEAQKAFDICKVRPFYEKLKQQQITFENAVMARINAAGEDDQPNVTALLPRVRAGLIDITNHINSRERLHPEKYERLVAEMNAVVTQIISSVRARESRKEETASETVL